MCWNTGQERWLSGQVRTLLFILSNHVVGHKVIYNYNARKSDTFSELQRSLPGLLCPYQFLHTYTHN